MIRKLFLMLFCFVTLHTHAQEQFVDTSHLRISLLTCGTGDEIWETFGHTAIRVTDSINGTDNVYNYGTFNGYGDDFEMQFMRGKLLYYVSYYPYQAFLQEYLEAHRSVQEQVLDINGLSKISIYSFLKHNALEEYKYYKYDFFFDNCATRIRDVFPEALGKKFKYRDVLPGGNLSYRDIINRYFYRVHWERVGVNILLGSKIDVPMTNNDIMFLPDYLRDAMAGATVNGKIVAGPMQLIEPGSEYKPAGVNMPLLLMIGICLLTMAGLFIPSLQVLGKIMSTLLLAITGLLGCLIMVMWLGTDHQACQNNFNLLWALPTNVIFAFASKRGKTLYPLVAIILIFVSLFLHVLRIQQLPIVELSPLLLSLVLVYGMIYRSNKQIAKSGS
ncbi:MAG: DUF4105 domain-containing protein [Bacteroidetes bacterium]|nr:DUF4105 domain-containing protein [Bacteroidota bacterium]